MAKAYRDVSAARRARLDPSAAAAHEVFEKAYDIAMQIVALREQAGLTQVELAERCGISQADISRIERGGTSPTTKTLQRIAEALDAEVRLVTKTGRSQAAVVSNIRQTNPAKPASTGMDERH